MAEPIEVPIPTGGWTGETLRAGFEAVAERIEEVADPGPPGLRGSGVFVIPAGPVVIPPEAQDGDIIFQELA